VLECHLPPPVVNPLILTGDGVVLGMVDLLDPETGTAGEYDGAHHLTARQRATDQVRDEGLRRPGLTVVRANRVDVGPESARTKHRLLDAYRQGSVTGESPRDWYWIEGPLPPPTPLW
jgi:hypothetical protein